MCMKGYILRGLRESHKLSQAALAGKLSVAPSILGKWERDEIQASYEMLKKVSCYFKCSIDYLFGLDTTSISAIQQRLLNEFDFMDNEGIEYIIGFARKMKGIQ